MQKSVFTTFENISFYDCAFHRMSFEHVKFEGKTVLNNTCIFSLPSRFDIAFYGAAEDFNVDTRCKVTGFAYRDIVNLPIEHHKIYKTDKKKVYEKVADTYYMLDQIWASKHVREEDNPRANFYYQRKKS